MRCPVVPQGVVLSACLRAMRCMVLTERRWRSTRILGCRCRLGSALPPLSTVRYASAPRYPVLTCGCCYQFGTMLIDVLPDRTTHIIPGTKHSTRMLEESIVLRQRVVPALAQGTRYYLQGQLRFSCTCRMRCAVCGPDPESCASASSQ
eukprot:2920702-Rhodomonas_salina.2